MMSSYSPLIRHLACMLFIIFGLTACDKKAESPRKPQVVSKKIIVKKIEDSRPAAEATGQVAAVQAPPDDTPKAKAVAVGTTAETPDQPQPPPAEGTSVQGHSGDRAPAAQAAGKMDVDEKSVGSPSPADQPVSDPGSAEIPRPPGSKPSMINPKKSGRLVNASGISSPSANVTGQRAERKVPADKADDFGFALVSQSSPAGVAGNQSYQYLPLGKIDPFQPLFQAEPVVKSKKVETKKRILKRRPPQTPLEKVDLSQLKLTGIILADSGNKALVEEASGKGYVIRKGTYIGIHSGQVTDIAGDRVVVEEEAADILGNLKKKKRELKLQKPLGEG